MADPVVPDAPGVPPLVRGGAAPPVPTLLTGDTINTVGVTSTPQWGLFKDGAPVLFPDSVVTFEFRQDWNLLDYPVEDGAFQTYNKVKTPAEIQMKVATGGSESNRAALLANVADLAETLDLYDVVTPEVGYLDYNIEHYDLRRTSDNGVGLIVIDVHLRQIRVTINPEFSNTKDPSGADPQNDGALQPVPATTTQANQIFSLFNNSQQTSIPQESGAPNSQFPGFVEPQFPSSQINLFPPNGAGF